VLGLARVTPPLQRRRGVPTVWQHREKRRRDAIVRRRRVAPGNLQRGTSGRRVTDGKSRQRLRIGVARPRSSVAARFALAASRNSSRRARACTHAPLPAASAPTLRRSRYLSFRHSYFLALSPAPSSPLRPRVHFVAARRSPGYTELSAVPHDPRRATIQLGIPSPRKPHAH